MKTTIQKVSLVFGIGFLAAAIAGFLATGMSNMDPDPATAPRALGIFPVNVLHNLVHLVFGIWGVVAMRSFGASRTFAKVAGATYLVLVVLGFLAPTGFGLVPLGGNDVWLHLVLGLPLAYFGFIARDVGEPAARTTATGR